MPFPRVPARLLAPVAAYLAEPRVRLAGLGLAIGAIAGIGLHPGVGSSLTILTLVLLIVGPAATPPKPVQASGPSEALAEVIDQTLAAAPSDLRSAVLMLQIDRFSQIEERSDRGVADGVMDVVLQRVRRCLRDRDHSVHLGGPVLAVAIAPARRLDLEAAIQLAARLQRSLADPVTVDGANFFLTASIGFVIADRLASADGAGLVRAARLAMIEASRSGPGAIRSYSNAMEERVAVRGSLAQEVTEAIHKGEILAFFQPQISARTGEVTGVEALARWHHPERGLIPPAEFLPALRQAGMMDRLGAHMVSQALGALRKWDDAGLRVPRAGVNFSSDELVDPRLVERISWELDRLDLSTDRLGIEVLETVVAGDSEDIISRNLSALARLGCRLDLDDFGTGHASITSIRRFAIGRIKIDRTFVTRIDADPEQQSMVAAILTMAERLGLDTLAEGVETPEEQAMLARLGCGHLQGFGIGRPMALDEATRWLAAAQVRTGGPVPFRRLVS